MRIERKTEMFRRYSREECGLPPKGADMFGDRLRIGASLAILAALACAAFFGGRIHAKYRELWLRGLPALVAGAGDDAELRSGLLRRGDMFAAALPERGRMRRDLAFAAMTAAEYAPRRAGYLGNALALLESEKPEADETPMEELARELALSGLHEEAGEHRAAFAALDRAERALNDVEDENVKRSFRLLLVNAKAYYLATASSNKTDAARALELARLAVSSRDELPGGGFASESAAFVDTLAAARFANGLAVEAGEAQSLALGLAPSRGLEIYLKHFDTFNGEPHAQ